MFFFNEPWFLILTGAILPIALLQEAAGWHWRRKTPPLLRFPSPSDYCRGWSGGAMGCSDSSLGGSRGHGHAEAALVYYEEVSWVRKRILRFRRSVRDRAVVQGWEGLRRWPVCYCRSWQLLKGDFSDSLTYWFSFTPLFSITWAQGHWGLTEGESRLKPARRRATCRQTAIRSHIRTYGQFRVSSWPHVHMDCGKRP